MSTIELRCFLKWIRSVWASALASTMMSLELRSFFHAEALIEAIKKSCKKESVVYFCVPNANSFHRVLAKRMGLIKEIDEKTERNVELQQNNVFDIESLRKILEEKGFFIIEYGTFFMKPFTHKQMYFALKEKIIDEKVLEGLYNCSEEFSENGNYGWHYSIKKR